MALAGLAAPRERLLRLGNVGASAALSEECARPMDLTRRVIQTKIFVEPAACQSDEGFPGWVARAVAFAETLSPN